MKSKLILAQVCLIFGFMILIAGLVMQYSGENSWGFTYGRSGNSGTATISGSGTIWTGIITLVISVVSFWYYHKEKKQRAAAMHTQHEKLQKTHKKVRWWY